MKTIAQKRWVLVNKNTFKTGRAYATRDLARARKTANQYIYDSVELKAVR